MELTKEQIEAIRGGDIVRVLPPEVGAECVVVKADQFHRLKTLFNDSGVLTADEQRIAIQEFGRIAGWDDESLDAYEFYRKPN